MTYKQNMIDTDSIKEEVIGYTNELNTQRKQAQYERIASKRQKSVEDTYNELIRKIRRSSPNKNISPLKATFLKSTENIFKEPGKVKDVSLCR